VTLLLWNDEKVQRVQKGSSATGAKLLFSVPFQIHAWLAGGARVERGAAQEGSLPVLRTSLFDAREN
jgi:hypothetical protein